MHGTRVVAEGLFHLTHVVSDLDTVDRWYDEVFSVTASTTATRSSPDATPP